MGYSLGRMGVATSGIGTRREDYGEEERRGGRRKINKMTKKRIIFSHVTRTCQLPSKKKKHESDRFVVIYQDFRTQGAICYKLKSRGQVATPLKGQGHWC